MHSKFIKVALLQLLFLASPILGAKNLDKLVKLAGDGVSIPLGSYGDFNIGLIALPVTQLCNNKLQNYTACIVCSIDCTYVHNSLGGGCGPNPTVNGKFTCVCDYADQKNFDGIKSAQQRCTPPKPFRNPPKQISAIALGALVYVLQLRSKTLQCIGTGTLCGTDCRTNHGAPAGMGYCTTQMARYDSSCTRTFCLCEKGKTSKQKNTNLLNKSNALEPYCLQ